MQEKTDNKGTSLGGYNFFVTYPLVDNYDAHNHFTHLDKRAVAHDQKGNVLLLACGKDHPEQSNNADGREQLFLFKEVQGGQKPFKRYLLQADELDDDTHILELKTCQNRAGDPIFYLHVSKARTREYILVADSLFTQVESEDATIEVNFHKIQLQHPLRQWSIGYNHQRELRLITSHEGDRKIYLYDHQGRKTSIDFALNSDEEIEKIELAYQQGFSENQRTCAIALVKSASGKKIVFVTSTASSSIALERTKISSIDLGHQPISTFGSITTNDDQFVIQLVTTTATIAVGGKEEEVAHLYECTFSLEIDDDDTFIINKHIVPMCEFSGEIEDIILSNAQIRTIAEKQVKYVEVVDTFFIATRGEQRFLHRTHPKQIETETSALNGVSVTPTWHTPLPLMPANNIHLSRSVATNALDIFIAKEENTQEGEVHIHLEHHWVDHETTIWKSKKVEVLYEEPVKVITTKHKTSSTYVRVVDKDSNVPIRNKEEEPKKTPAVSPIAFKFEEVQISASQELSVMINDRHYQLHPKEYITVPLDKMGGLSIINKTKSIQTPIYLLSYKGAENAVRVRTTGHIEGQLQNKDAQGRFLNKLRDQSKGKYQPSTEHQDSLTAIHGTRKGLDTSDAITVVKREAVTYTQFKAHHPEYVSPHIPGFFMALSQTEKQGIQLFTNQEAWVKHRGVELALYQQELQGFGGFIKHVVGDIVHAAKHIVKDVVHFVVEEAEGVYHLTIALAHGDFKAVIHSLEEMWDTIDSFCNCILKDLADLAADLIFDVLAFVMGKEVFQDMFLLQDVYVKLFNITAHTVKHSVEELETKVQNEIDDLISWADKKIGKAPDKKDQSSEVLELLKVLLDNPVLNYISDLIQRAISKLLSLIHHSSGQDDFPQFDLSKLKHDEEQLINDVLTLMKKSFEDVAQLDFKMLLNDLENELLNVAEDILNIVGDLVISALDYFVQLITYLENHASKKLEIPYLSEFYSEIARKTFDNPTEEQTSLSLEKAAALVFAIPSDFLFKLIGRFDHHRPSLKRIQGISEQDIRTKNIEELITIIKGEASTNTVSGIDLIADLAGIVDLLYEIIENGRNALHKMSEGAGELKEWNPKIPLFIGLGANAISVFAIWCGSDSEKRKLRSILLFLDTLLLGATYGLSQIKSPAGVSANGAFDKFIVYAQRFLFVATVVISSVKFGKSIYEQKGADVLYNGSSLWITLLNKAYTTMMSELSKQEIVEAQEVFLPEILTVLGATLKIGILWKEDL